MSLSRLVARPLMSTIFLVGPIGTWKNAEAIAPQVRNVTEPLAAAAERVGIPVPADRTLWVKANAAIQVAAGLALATGRYPRLASAVLGASLIPTTIGGHAFWGEEDPQTRAGQRIQFAKNLSLLGGLIIAARDTDGQPGLAWRARRAAKDARREAKNLARSARQEARIAKAQLGSH